MRRMLSSLAIAALLPACHVTHDMQQTRYDRVRAFIDDRLPYQHPSRGPMMVYASSLEQLLRRPKDPDSVKAMMMADSCLGLFHTGTLVGETRRGVEGMLMNTEEREDTYRRYVVASSEVALSRDEMECREQ